mmetsp:Transcript_9442/g.12335  ORF Transcript_9442/g.12335 Transcript_9442/m.12335 type:complete len:411 (-) Transcript_9442:793-2025(-)
MKSEGSRSSSDENGGRISKKSATLKDWIYRERRRKRPNQHVAGAAMENLYEILSASQLRRPQTRSTSTSKAESFCNIFNAGRSLVPKLENDTAEIRLLAEIALILSDLKVAQKIRKSEVIIVPIDVIFQAIINQFVAADRDSTYVHRLNRLPTSAFQEFSKGLKSIFLIERRKQKKPGRFKDATLLTLDRIRNAELKPNESYRPTKRPKLEQQSVSKEIKAEAVKSKAKEGNNTTVAQVKAPGKKEVADKKKSNPGGGDDAALVQAKASGKKEATDKKQTTPKGRDDDALVQAKETGKKEIADKKRLKPKGGDDSAVVQAKEPGKKETADKKQPRQRKEDGEKKEKKLETRESQVVEPATVKDEIIIPNKSLLPLKQQIDDLFANHDRIEEKVNSILRALHGDFSEFESQ